MAMGEIERAVVYHAGADCGQGAHTVFLQMAAEMLGLPVDKIELVLSDTASSGNSGSASASRLTFMAGHSIRARRKDALKKWRNEERPAIAHHVYRPRPTTAMDDETGEATRTSPMAMWRRAPKWKWTSRPATCAC